MQWCCTEDTTDQEVHGHKLVWQNSQQSQGKKEKKKITVLQTMTSEAISSPKG